MISSRIATIYLLMWFCSDVDNPASHDTYYYIDASASRRAAPKLMPDHSADLNGKLARPRTDAPAIEEAGRKLSVGELVPVGSGSQSTVALRGLFPSDPIPRLREAEAQRLARAKVALIGGLCMLSASRG